MIGGLTDGSDAHLPAAFSAVPTCTSSMHARKWTCWSVVTDASNAHSVARSHEQSCSSTHGPSAWRTAALSAKFVSPLKSSNSCLKSPLPKVSHPGHLEPKKYVTLLEARGAKLVMALTRVSIRLL